MNVDTQASSHCCFLCSFFLSSFRLLLRGFTVGTRRTLHSVKETPKANVRGVSARNCRQMSFYKLFDARTGGTRRNQNFWESEREKVCCPQCGMPHGRKSKALTFSLYRWPSHELEIRLVLPGVSRCFFKKRSRIRMTNKEDSTELCVKSTGACGSFRAEGWVWVGIVAFDGACQILVELLRQDLVPTDFLLLLFSEALAVSEFVMRAFLFSITLVSETNFVETSEDGIFRRTLTSFRDVFLCFTVKYFWTVIFIVDSLEFIYFCENEAHTVDIVLASVQLFKAFYVFSFVCDIKLTKYRNWLA